MMYRASEMLARTLLEGDVVKGWLIVQEHASQGFNSVFIYEQLFTKAMYHIGDLWREGKISVADEHLATGICDYLVTRYTANLRKCTEKQQKQRALLFCVEGEEHYLGLKMIAALFTQYGWDVKHLGANLPLAYAKHGALRWQPEVIGLSFSQAHLLALVQEYITTLEQLSWQPTILVGGRLVSSLDITNTKNTIILENALQAEQWLQQAKKGFTKEEVAYEA